MRPVGVLIPTPRPFIPDILSAANMSNTIQAV
jgi:hypothetical protein